MARIRWLPVGLVMTLFGASAAWSQCTVTDTQSLNAAIGACATITLGANIQLAGNVAPIDGNLTINGGGFTINGGGQFQGLRITGGTVSINDLTVNGTVAQGGAGGSGMGGGLYIGSGATVTTDDVALTNNEAAGGGVAIGAGGSGGTGYGGGLYDAGSLIANGTLILSGDKALGGAGGTGGTGGNALGGGIDVASGGALTISNVTISGNAATGGAGGTGGTGGSALGGGIDVAPDGSLTIGNVTISGNAATGGAGGTGGTGGSALGGGVYANNGNVLGFNGSVTLSGNQAVGGAGAGGNGLSSGGGVLVLSGNMAFSPSANVIQTVAGPIAGGGGLTKDGAGVLTLSGANTYAGATTVNAGVLSLQSSLALGSGAVTVNSGAAIDLNETTQKVSGLDLSGVIDDTLGGVGVGEYGALDASGAVTIDGALALSVCRICFTLAVGDQFDIMSFDALSGGFSAFSFDGASCAWSPSGSGGAADCGHGLDFLLSEMPGSGPDGFYQLEVKGIATVPEPGTLPLIASAIFIFLLIRQTPKARRYAGLAMASRLIARRR